MLESHRHARRWWNRALALHLILFGLAWLVALDTMMPLPFFEFVALHPSALLIFLLWLPVLGLHILAHVTSERQWLILYSGRDAYREGYDDAMHHLTDTADEPRLLLDDDGELVDARDKPKRQEER